MYHFLFLSFFFSLSIFFFFFCWGLIRGFASPPLLCESWRSSNFPFLMNREKIERALLFAFEISKPISLDSWNTLYILISNSTTDLSLLSFISRVSFFKLFAAFLFGGLAWLLGVPVSGVNSNKGGYIAIFRQLIGSLLLRVLLGFWLWLLRWDQAFITYTVASLDRYRNPVRSVF